jgi:hypothetical protein
MTSVSVGIGETPIIAYCRRDGQIAGLSGLAGKAIVVFMKNAHGLLLLLLPLLAGCATTQLERKENLVDRQGIDVIGSPADRVHVVIKDDKSIERYCKGPGPDFSVTASNGVNFGASVPLASGASVGSSSGRGALDLGGRSPAVLLAREMFYRTCELIVNIHADKTTAIALYKSTMDAVERIAALEAPQADKSTVAASAPPPAVSGLPAGLPPQPAPAPAPAAPPAPAPSNQ